VTPGDNLILFEQIFSTCKLDPFSAECSPKGLQGRPWSYIKALQTWPNFFGGGVRIVNQEEFCRIGSVHFIGRPTFDF
jgi:hypothetical protein